MGLAIVEQCDPCETSHELPPSTLMKETSLVGMSEQETLSNKSGHRSDV